MTLRWRRPKAENLDEPEPRVPGYGSLVRIAARPCTELFAAVETENSRPVALKVLHLGAIEADLLREFGSDMNVVLGLSDHPNLVTVFRMASSSTGLPVVVSELCRGPVSEHRADPPGASAGHKPAQGAAGARWSPQEVTRFGLKIAAALGTVHAAGLVHGAVKPDNVLVTVFGEPALSDVGLAALRPAFRMSESGPPAPDPHAAPETFEGGPADAATDVYGLASTMYQLLTGRPPFAPFEGESPASLILRIVRDPVVPLREADVPLSLSEVFESALDKDPERRPPDADALAGRLRRIGEEEGWSQSPLWPAVVVGARAPAEPDRDSAPDEARPEAVPLSPRGPGIAEPPPAPRNVVEPPEARRGRMTDG